MEKSSRFREIVFTVDVHPEATNIEELLELQKTFEDLGPELFKEASPFIFRPTYYRIQKAGTASNKKVNNFVNNVLDIIDQIFGNTEVHYAVKNSSTFYSNGGVSTKNALWDIEITFLAKRFEEDS